MGGFCIFEAMIRSLWLFLLACVLLVAGCRRDVPVADFSVADTNCVPPCSVQFTNLSSGDDLYYVWNFGDGIIVSGEDSPGHVYTRGGTYQVSLSATNQAGTDRQVKTVTVSYFPDSLRLIGVQVVAIGACADTPDVRYVLEDFFGEPVSRSGMLPNVGCSQLPVSIPPGVAFWTPNTNDVFFTLFNGAEGGPSPEMYNKRILQRDILWAADASALAPYTGTLILKSPAETGATLTLKLTFLGKDV